MSYLLQLIARKAFWPSKQHTPFVIIHETDGDWYLVAGPDVPSLLNEEAFASRLRSTWP